MHVLGHLADKIGQSDAINKTSFVKQPTGTIQDLNFRLWRNINDLACITSVQMDQIRKKIGMHVLSYLAVEIGKSDVNRNTSFL